MKVTRYNGILSWIDQKKCIGFVSLDGKHDGFNLKNMIYVDSSYLNKAEQKRYQFLTNGQEVSFQIEKGHKTVSAIGITPVFQN